MVWIQIALLDYGAKWTVESINQWLEENRLKQTKCTFLVIWRFDLFLLLELLNHLFHTLLTRPDYGKHDYRKRGAVTH